MTATDRLSEPSRPDATGHLDGVSNGAELAAMLTLVRETAGLSIRDVARRTGIPSATLGGYYSGRHLPARPHETLLPVLRACGVPESRFPDWVSALVRARRAPGPRPQSAHQPYRGLANFDSDDAEWFFGREQVTQRVLDRISAVTVQAGDPAIIVVTGPSGSGKSSLLRAGLMPTFGGEVAAMTPGSSPLSALAAVLARRCDRGTAEVQVALRTEPPPPWLARAMPAMLVVDQFEELFTAGAGEEHRDLFVESLCRLTTGTAAVPDRPVVVLGLRSDFYRQAGALPGLLSSLENGQIVLGAMSESELRSAIVEPARHAGGKVDDELIELLLREMTAPGGHRYAHDPGALPLLSHALMETWTVAGNGHLGREQYLATGGIEGAAQQTAELLFGQLDERRQALVRRIFLRLTNVGDGQPLTRRRVAEPELRSLSEQSEEIDEVLARFVAARLLTSDAAHIEISHESLLTAWPRLASWVEDDLTSLRRLRQLTALAQQWEADGRDEDELLRGLRLEDTQRWLSDDPRRAEDLNRTEREYLADSADAEARRRHLETRVARRTRQLLGTVSALTIVACLLTVFAFQARSRSNSAEAAAQEQRDQAESRQLAVEAEQLEAHDPDVATKIALAGYKISPTVEARSALLDSAAVASPTRLLAQPGPTAMALSSDGTSVAVSNASAGSVQLFSRSGSAVPTRAGKLPGLGRGHQLFALAFAPGSATLATGGADSSVRLWNVRDPAHPRLIGSPLYGIKQAVETIAFSPNGRLMVVGGGGSAVRLWDVSVPDSPRLAGSLTRMPDAVRSVSFAPDGTTIAVAGEKGLLQRWNVADPGHPRRLNNLADPPPQSTTVTSVAFSPDGSLLAAGRKDGVVQVWNRMATTTPMPVTTGIAKLSDWVNVVAFSHDGHRLAAGSSNDSAVLWSVPTWQQEQVLPHAGPVDGAVFLPDGSGLFTASEDGAAHLWPLPGPVLTRTADNIWSATVSRNGLVAVGSQSASSAAQLWQLDASGATAVGAVGEPLKLASSGTSAISPDGRLLALGATTGALMLWNVTDTRHPIMLERLAGIPSAPESVAFDPQSRLVAEVGDGGQARMWNVSDPAHRVVLPVPAHTGNFYDVDFAPDGRTVAAATIDGTVRLWDISNPRHPKSLAVVKASSTYTYSVAFSPDGRLLAAGSSDGIVRLWSMANPAAPAALGLPLTGATDTLFSLSVSPDSRLLAAASGDHTVRVWDISDPEHATQYAVLRAPATSAYTVSFSADGTQLVAGGGSGDAHLWPVTAASASRQICRNGGDELTRAEWLSYVPDRPYRSPCQPL